MITLTGDCSKKPVSISRGFTLIELVVVLTILSLVAALAIPVVTTSIVRAKEAVLKENLLVTREAIDDYYSDNGDYPGSLEDLVEKKYLRSLPYDPFTGDSESWTLIESENPDEYGIEDIKSYSDKESLEGSSYSDW